MKETKLVRFSNESEVQTVELDMKQFLFSREFESEIWGVYKGAYIAIQKEQKEQNEPIEQY